MAETAEMVEIKPSDTLASSIWGDETTPTMQTQPPTAIVTEPIAPTQEATPAPTEAIVEKPFDVNEFLKSTFNVDSVDAAKTQWQELQKLKDIKPVEFANEQSQKYFDYIKSGKEDELYEHLHKKKELGSIAATDVEKVDNALSIIKTQLKYQNKDYTSQDISDIIEDKYTVPEKPELGDIEDETSFNNRIAKWNSQVEKINRAIVRDARTAKTELSKLNEEVVLPDINYTNPKVEADRQKELAENAQLRELFETSLNSEFKNFNGYNVSYKNGDVDVSVQYGVPDDEKTVYKEKVLDLNPPEFFGTRWFNEDGKPKTETMISDVYLLENKDKIFNKIITDTANKVMDFYIKGQKNISVNGNIQQGNFNPNVQNQQQKLAEDVWSV